MTKREAFAVRVQVAGLRAGLGQARLLLARRLRATEKP